MFHLFTHAFFKALLFLAAGSVMHAMGDVIDMRRFSSEHALQSHTGHSFRGRRWQGSVAAGFWSKDDIIASWHSLSQ